MSLRNMTEAQIERLFDDAQRRLSELTAAVNRHEERLNNQYAQTEELIKRVTKIEKYLETLGDSLERKP